MQYKRVADPHLQEISGKIVGVMCALVLLHVALVFAGWVLHDPWLIHFPIASRYGTVMPLTAVGQLMCVAALWVQRREDRVTPAARALAMMLAGTIILIGMLVIREHVPGRELRIDLLLFPESVTDIVGSRSGRPAIATAICFMLLGLALLALDVRAKWAQVVVQVTLLLVVLIALERCVGFLYREIGLFAPRWRLFGRSVYQPMSPTSAVAFIWLAVGVLYARLHRRDGWVGLFYTRGPHQLMARWMIPVGILTPILFGWLGMIALRAGLRGTVMPLSLVVSGMIVLLLTVILLNARAMRHADAGRVKMEHALAERERLQHAVLENAGAGIVVLDVSGCAVSSNRTLRGMLGYSEAELGKTPFWILMRSKHPGENSRLFRELVWGQRNSYTIETLCTRKDGAVFWAAITTSVVRDDEGRTELVIAMLQDVTERREAEEAQKRLNDIIEATPDFVGVSDLHNRVVYVNAAGRHLTGLSEGEVTGLEIGDFHPAECAQRVLEEGIPTAIRDGVWTGE
ncbi:MAG TPA: PAS domain S-box protein, partial [Longimicrobiales bacterium]